jgi:hypothetical protein
MSGELKHALQEFTDTELLEELDRRKKGNPKPLEFPNFDHVKKACAEHVQSIIDGTYHEDNDDAHYIFEEAMKAVYGADIFKWYNANT